MYKIIGADGKEYGPVTADQLRQWIAEGRVNAQTRILPEGGTEWRSLSEFPEFAPAFPSAPPTLPAGIAAPAIMGADANSVAAEQVSGPAIGLIVVAILELFAGVLSLIWQLAFSSLNAVHQAEGPWRQMGISSAMFSGAFAVVGAIIGMLIAGLILFGGIKMKKLESYGLAMAASIVAMLPCSICCVIGLPIGIWALVVLSKPEVKSAFH